MTYDPTRIRALRVRENHPPRNPDRIPRILEKLGKLWQKYPDMRLGQLLQNARGAEGTELFYLEDDVLEKRIDEGFGNG